MRLLRHVEEENAPLADAARMCLLRRNLITRPRLLHRLDEVRAARITRVRAPAGYGKTCLLQQWADALTENEIAATMIRCDSATRDPVELVRCATANSASGHPVDIRSFVGAETPLSPEFIASRIAENCAHPTRQQVLLFDDADRFKGTDAMRCIRVLVESAPPNLHIVIASRSQLDLPFARWRALGHLAELSARDLRFTMDETRDFFAMVGMADMTEDQLAVIHDRGEGWAVGLRLAALAFASQRKRQEVVRGLSGRRREIWDFFAEDVFARQPEDMRRFLLTISVLDEFCAPLCNALTGTRNGQQMLRRCEDVGLFLHPLDDTRNWFRFHRLFHEFLAATRAAEMAEDEVALRERACDWLLEACRYPDAFEQALHAGNPDRAAGILDSRLDEMFDRGEARTIQRLAAQLPAETRAQFPRIMLAEAWPLAIKWQFAQSGELLETCRARIDELGRAGTTPEPELQAMRRLLSHREMMLALLHDEMPKVESLGRALMRSNRDTHPLITGSIHSAYMASQRELFKLKDLHAIDSAALEYLNRCKSQHLLIAHDATAGRAFYLAGEPEIALRRLHNGLQATIHLYGDEVPLGAMTALPLAEVLYERNELAEAQSLIDTYLPIATEIGSVDQLCSGWIVRARLQHGNGDVDGGLSTLHHAITFAARSGFKRLALQAAEQRAWHLLRVGRTDEAGRIARRAGLPVSAAAAMPVGTVTSHDEARALMWVSWAETQKRHTEALEVARQWRGFTVSAGATYSAIRWDLRIAHLLLANGDTRSAKRSLRRAINLAAPGRYMRIFLDEPLLLSSLLTDGRDDSQPETVPTFQRALIEQHRLEHGHATPLPPEPEPAPHTFGAALAAHEIEVLKLIAAGRSNREVGDWMGMTEGTIKWHLQQIYNKIGVRRRVLAVERARHLGLID